MRVEPGSAARTGRTDRRRRDHAGRRAVSTDASAGHAFVRRRWPGSTRAGRRHARRRAFCDDSGTMTPHPAGDPLGLLDPSLDAPADEALGQGPDARRSQALGRVVEVVGDLGSGGSPPHGRNRVRPSGHQPAHSSDTALAGSGGPRCARGARGARRVGPGRPPKVRQACVRGRVSQRGADHPRGLGRVRGGHARRAGMDRRALLDPDPDRAAFARHRRSRCRPAIPSSPGRPPLA